MRWIPQEVALDVRSRDPISGAKLCLPASLKRPQWWSGSSPPPNPSNSPCAQSLRRGLKIGDSLAVKRLLPDGRPPRLARHGQLVRMDLLKETWHRTNLQYHPRRFAREPGTFPQGRRAPRRHFVTGHIDGTAPSRVGNAPEATTSSKSPRRPT